MTECTHKQYTILSHTYKVCVSPHSCNPEAHDYVTNKLTCNRCGAVLTENVNGVQVEVEDWLSPDNNRPF